MTINGTVLRGKDTNEGTPSKLTLETGFACDCLELKWHNNRTGLSCINADVYDAVLWESPHLGCNQDIMVDLYDGSGTINIRHYVYRLADKNGRKDCLIHNGAFAGEVQLGEETHVKGCTIVGRGYAVAKRDDGGGMQMAILMSRPVLAELIQHTKGEPLRLTYQWADGCAPDDLTDAQA